VPPDQSNLFEVQLNQIAMQDSLVADSTSYYITNEQKWRETMKVSLTIVALGLAFCTAVAQPPLQSDKLAPTPPMGWNSWNHYAKTVTETDVREAADMLVATGMRDAGYVYVNIDGSWEGYRDANGVLRPNPQKFSDMKALADYVHARGLKFGIYSTPGPGTCGNFAGSYGYEEQDAKMFASWGVDFLKYDLCTFRTIMSAQGGNDLGKQREIMEAAYKKMHDALDATGRPIVYSLCQYGLGNVWEWGPKVGGSMWRTTDDIKDTYMSMSGIGFAQAGLSKYAAPGHWNDPDMLEVGNGGMTGDEYRTHMSLWSILAAPLLAGNDLDHMSAETLSILMNHEVIAVDQDPLGKQGDRVWAVGELEFWSKPLKDGSLAVALFNRQNSPTLMTFHLSDLGWKGPASARDLWKHEDVGTINDSYTASVPRHGVIMLMLRKP
jgi:alpha-galactosidase